ncbi:MAG TPA: lysylphosphatidylglycerol synthase domain-containing protein [Stellaceae bacterium]|nr:lysylphosphatidylglycerol synthase domain-containing protein [Stellaceae bacterium]
MKRVAILGILAGLALTTLLVLHFGLSQVGAALRAAGVLGLAAITAIHLAAMAVMGIAWWVVAGGSEAARGPWSFIWGRVIRDSASEVLPLSQVGGYVLGARAVVLRGIGAASAAATTVVDLTLECFSQIAYTALGLVLLVELQPGATLAYPVLIGLGIAVCALAGFVLTQQRGAGLFDRITQRLARQWLAALSAGAGAVQAEIRRAYVRKGGIALCFLLHLAAWIGTSVEAWLALRLMGAPLGLGPVLVIESLLYAIRSVAFAVPNALGVQEGAYIMLGAAFGLTPEVALALSLLKRGRDLLIGVPALLAWQYLEGRRFWGRAALKGVAGKPAEQPARAAD